MKVFFFLPLFLIAIWLITTLIYHFVKSQKRKAKFIPITPEEEALSLMVDLICISMQNEKEDWIFGTHRIDNHKKKISIWIANNDFGLGLRVDGEKASPHDGDLPLNLRTVIWEAYKKRDAFQSMKSIGDVVNRWRIMDEQQRRIDKE